mgnify:CR=1 FL=1
MEPMEVINDAMLDQIEIYLKEIGEFYPFGVLLRHDSKIISITTVEDKIEKSIEQNKREIETRVLESCEFHSGGYSVDTIVDGVPKIQMNFISKQSDGWIQVYLPYKLVDNKIDYGEFES